MNSSITLCIIALLFALSLYEPCMALLPSHTINRARSITPKTPIISKFNQGEVIPSYGQQIVQRDHSLKDILGLGPAELGIIIVVGLVLFGPETLKSLSKDVGRAAAELKEIPKTFKEGMDEGAKSGEVERMKALAAEKRKLRDEKLAKKKTEDNEDEDDDDDDDD